MQNPTIQPAHWSKDFVEHIRTVHFTLIALCAGLIALASFPGKTEIRTAREQASEILKVTNTWDDALFETAANETVKIRDKSVIGGLYIFTDSATDSDAVFADFDTSLTFDAHTVWFRPSFAPRSWIVDIRERIPAELFPDPESIEGEPVEGSSVLLVGAPRSISTFRKLWDNLIPPGRIVIPGKPEDCFASDNASDPFGDGEGFEFNKTKCEIRPHDPSRKAEQVEMSFWEPVGIKKDAIADLGQKKWRYEFITERVIPQATTQKVFLPVRAVFHVDFHPQEVLIRRSEKWQGKNGEAFKDAFRELASVDESFEDADILSAVRILDAEAKRTGDAFEAMGLKIPAEVAVRCGVLLVIVVQLYLWIHLHEFGNRLDRDAGFDVAWIGVYFSKSARAMSFVSLVVLPACTVVLLSIRGLELTEDKRLAWVALVVSNAVSLVLSYFILKVLPQPLSPSTKGSESDNADRTKKKT